MNNNTQEDVPPEQEAPELPQTEDDPSKFLPTPEYIKRADQKHNSEMDTFKNSSALLLVCFSFFCVLITLIVQLIRHESISQSLEFIKTVGVMSLGFLFGVNAKHST